MNTDFEMHLTRELQSYAAVADGAATDAEVERAVAQRRPVGGLRWPFAAVGRRSWLVAATLLALLALTSVAVGALFLRDPQPSAPFRLSIVETGSPEGIWEWDADEHSWTQISGSPRWSHSPDGRWLTFATSELLLRELGSSGARAETVIWKRIGLPDGGTTLPFGTWSRDSRGLLAILPDGTLRVADITARPITVATYPGFPEPIDIYRYAWDRVGTDGHPRVVAIADSGTVYLLDTAQGAARSVVRLAAWPPDSDGPVQPLPALSPDGSRAAVIDRDGGVNVIDLIGGTATAVAREPAFAAQPLWGWSQDGRWIGAGDRMVEAVTGAQVRLPGATATGCSSVPAWGPTGHTVAWLGDGFLRTRDDAGNLTQRQLACPNGPDTTGTSVAWRPDAGAIAVALSAMGTDDLPVGGSILVFDMRGSKWTEVASDDRPYMHYTLHWVPIP